MLSPWQLSSVTAGWVLEMGANPGLGTACARDNLATRPANFEMQIPM